MLDMNKLDAKQNSDSSSSDSNSYDDWLKKFQADSLAFWRAETAKEACKPSPDPLRVEKRLFLAQLIETRYKQRLSQNQLAKLSGVSQTAISRLENGRGNPSLRTLLKVAKALDANLMLD